VADIGDPAFPWLALALALELLRQVLQQRRLVVGVCLGAQSLAVAAGGTAEPMGLREVGFGAVSWTVDPAREPRGAGTPHG
jgi:GMP synthase-like glutamine amidotransferase